MAKTVQVKLGERSYPIHIGCGLDLGSVLKGRGGCRALIVSDNNVDPLHGEHCRLALEANGVECRRAVIPAGEATKELKWVGELYDRACDAELDRSGVIVALGGGVVGDLAGFVAATYLRGIRLVQVPTSLLAMVDSSVGGKTGINLRQGKNLVGAFHQPIEVDADLALLATLPAREYVSGLAEVVKYGVIWDAAFFALLEKHSEGLLRRDAGLLEQVVARCCEIKAEVVAIDERETGPRAILNFGHTLGHAIETVGGYGRWLHGEAVAIGMHFAVAVSTREMGLAPAEAGRVVGLLERLGLPTRVGGAEPVLDWAAVRTAMQADKKTLRKTPRFVLAKKIGAVVMGHEVAEETLAEGWHVCS